MEIVNVANGVEERGHGDGTVDEVADSQDEEGEGEGEGSDDDAPEAVSMGAGKQEAEKREEEAKRVIEAYFPRTYPPPSVLAGANALIVKKKQRGRSERSGTQS